MSLINNAIDDLFGALVSGGVAGVIFWRTGRGRNRQLGDAWRQQADELDTRLARQYQGEITYLRKQLGDCRTETKRLNRLLNRQRGEGDD